MNIVSTSYGEFYWNDEVLLWLSRNHKQRIDWEGIECLVLSESAGEQLVIPYGTLPLNTNGSRPLNGQKCHKPWWIKLTPQPRFFYRQFSVYGWQHSQPRRSGCWGYGFGKRSQEPKIRLLRG